MLAFQPGRPHEAVEHPAPEVPGGRLPLYRRIADSIAFEIRRGLHGPGMPLPSESTLTRLFGVSRVTVRAALAELVRRKLIERRQGAGSFVRAGTIHRPLGTLADFRSEAERHGRKAATRLLSLVAREPTISELFKFGVDAPARVWEVTRLRSLDQTPALLQVTVLPESALGSDAVDVLRSGSLYDYLARRGMRPVCAEDVVEAVALQAEAAELVKLPAGSPVFRFFRIGRTAAGAVVELSESLIRSDSYKLVFHPRLERSQ